MGKITIYLAICCFCFTQVKGQEEDKQLIQQAKSIEKQLHAAISDKSITGNCKVAVQRAINGIPSLNRDKLDNNTREKLVNAANKYLTLSKSCDNNEMQKISAGFTRLVDNLKGSNIAGQSGRTDSLTAKKTSRPGKIQVKLIDSVSRTGFNYVLTIDTLKKTIAYSKTSSESNGLSTAGLLAKQSYQVRVSPEQGKDSGKTDPATVITLNKPVTISEATAAQKQPVDEGYERKNLRNYIDALFKKIAFLCIIVTLVSLLLSSVNVLYAYSFFKWHLLSVKQVAEYGHALQVSPDLGGPLSNVVLPPHVSMPLKEPELESNQQSQYAPVALHEPGSADRYFLSEIMITAGPRKKFMSEPDADKDLGEDICGFVSNGKQLLIWLLDGTSDLHCLKNPLDRREYFSSRLLAQFLANKLRSTFTKRGEESLDQVILQAIRDVRADWLRVINQLPVEEKNILKTNIGNKNIPECATTLLIGRLDINGHLTAYRSGDSKMFLFSAPEANSIRFIETTLADKNEESNDRIFFRLVLTPEGDFDIVFNLPKYEVLKTDNVHTLIAFSDGIGMATELLLKKQYSAQPDEIRNEIIFQSQGTADDKSICFVEIKEAGK